MASGKRLSKPSSAKSPGRLRTAIWMGLATADNHTFKPLILLDNISSIALNFERSNAAALTVSNRLQPIFTLPSIGMIGTDMAQCQVMVLRHLAGPHNEDMPWRGI